MIESDILKAEESEHHAQHHTATIVADATPDVLQNHSVDHIETDHEEDHHNEQHHHHHERSTVMKTGLVALLVGLAICILGIPSAKACIISARNIQIANTSVVERSDAISNDIADITIVPERIDTISNVIANNAIVPERIDTISNVIANNAIVPERIDTISNVIANNAIVPERIDTISNDAIADNVIASERLIGINGNNKISRAIRFQRLNSIGGLDITGKIESSRVNREISTADPIEAVNEISAIAIAQINLIGDNQNDINAGIVNV